MSSKSQTIIINIDNHTYPSWESYLSNLLNKIRSVDLIIDCKNIDLSCKDISSIIKISNKYHCKIISFYSTSPKTIVSTKSLGYSSHLIIEENSDFSLINQTLDFSKTHFHQGTVRSGEYLETPGDLLILGDVNPGAIVSAKGNVIIWGRLLGIAHAGCKGNSQAKIAALQLRPVQLRIADKIARGPKEKPQLGFAEQATIDSERIIISPIELS